MKLPIQFRNRPTGFSASPSHSKKSRSHLGGAGGGGTGDRLNWIEGSAFSASCAAANPSAAPAASCAFPPIASLPAHRSRCIVKELDEARPGATAKCAGQPGGAWSGSGAGKGATMASAAVEGGERSVSIGRVFSRAFGTIGANPATTFGIGLLFGALPSLLVDYAIKNFRAETFAAL